MTINYSRLQNFVKQMFFYESLQTIRVATVSVADIQSGRALSLWL